MENHVKKTSQDVIAGLKIEGGSVPPKEKDVINDDPEITSEKDLDELAHDEIGEVDKEDEEIDSDEKVHQKNEDLYDENEEEDIDDMMHKNYPGIY